MLLVKTTIGPSPIEGIGLFADEYIKKGTAVWRFNSELDRELSPEQMNALPEPARNQMLKYAYQSYASKNYIIDADNGRYMNHSDSPNVAKRVGNYIVCFDDARFFNHKNEPNTADFKIDGEQEPHTIAIRDISPGEEITIDYRIFPEGIDFEPKS